MNQVHNIDPDKVISMQKLRERVEKELQDPKTAGSVGFEKLDQATSATEYCRLGQAIKDIARKSKHMIYRVFERPDRAFDPQLFLVGSFWKAPKEGETLSREEEEIYGRKFAAMHYAVTEIKRALCGHNARIFVEGDGTAHGRAYVPREYRQKGFALGIGKKTFSQKEAYNHMGLSFTASSFHKEKKDQINRGELPEETTPIHILPGLDYRVVSDFYEAYTAIERLKKKRKLTVSEQYMQKIASKMVAEFKQTHLQSLIEQEEAFYKPINEFLKQGEVNVAVVLSDFFHLESPVLSKLLRDDRTNTVSMVPLLYET